MHRLVLLCLGLALALTLGACESKQEPPAEEPPATADSQPPEEPPPPPTPPIFETFQEKPVLSLFPRAGDYRPAQDSENFAYWVTFIDHLSRTSGLVESKDERANRAWAFRSIDTIDSVGYFSPLAVEPATRYRVSFRLQTDLPEGASAGVGILEFDEFLWIGEQFSEEEVEEHQRDARDGMRLSGSVRLDDVQSFEFVTGPETRMIHLVLFREGPHNRTPLIFDDIRVEPAAPDTAAPAEGNQEKSSS